MPVSQIQGIINRRRLRNKRLRRPRPVRKPTRAENRYAKAVVKATSKGIDLVGSVLVPELAGIARRAGIREDAPAPWPDLLSSVFGDMRARWEGAAAITEAVAEDAANDIAGFNEASLRRQLRSVVGVDVFFGDEQLDSLLSSWVSTSAGRIKSVPEQLYGELEGIIGNGFRMGIRASEMAGKIAERTDIARRKAERIARDQIGTLNSQLTRQRHQGLGIDSFVWRTSRDERVRLSHRAIDGRVFAYSDPPIVDGSPSLPGTPPNCRCTAEPVVAGVGSSAPRRRRSRQATAP